ncbi:glycosyltransferase [Streptococcus uberis]
MKILHFNSTLSSNSGVISVLMNYYRNIDKNSVQFDFLYFIDSETSCQTEIEELGGHCYKISSPLKIIQFRKELKEFLNSKLENYDILHIHDWIFAMLVYSIARHFKKLKIIVHSHATRYSDSLIASIRNRLMCIGLNKKIPYKFACSKAAGDFLFKNNDYYVVNNAIDLSKFKYDDFIRKKIRSEFQLEDKLVLGHVGAFVNQKNHIFLLEIFNELLKIHPESVLMLAGDGVLRDIIENKAKQMNIYENIFFLGRRNDIENLYQVMDVFILPSFFEGLPMVGVEAQCSGLPVVFSSEISREVGIGNYIFLDLNTSASVWAVEVLKLFEDSKCTMREEGYFNAQNNGFDIISEAKRLQIKYEKIVKGC